MELDPGTGAVSAAIEARLQGRGAAHRSGIRPIDGPLSLSKHLRTRAHLVDVVNLDSVLDRERLAEVDAVVSGLPWALIAADKQQLILERVAASLAPSGVFTAFAYLHGLGLAAVRHLRQSLP
ncbi:hypothetical protein GCM10011609_88310 [Lentzea pudingi]|uniref:Uncharacterized protein n=1 Tax=Lentzea pudingi TaxID=1789439 RepID=A0ABQ2ITX5_9PSEU|nr:hypothetical protein GCM10011609_88310 [Lentzea pudingi]